MTERRLSKTQLEAFRSCERKWGWPYVANVAGLGNKFDLGIRMHAQLENWLRNRVRPNPLTEEGRIAESGLHHLPVPSDDLVVESELFTITRSAIYHGFADWIEPPDLEVLEFPIVGDHKSTVDFKWALTSADLETDIQANIYVRAAMQMFGTDAAIAKWVYYRTRGAAKSHAVEARLSNTQVKRTFDEIVDPLADSLHSVSDAVAQELTTNADTTRAVLQLRPNYKACSDYGGCPYRELCNIDAKGRFAAMVAHSSLADKMRAKKLEQQKAEEPTAKELAPKVEAAPASPSKINPPEGGSLKERMKSLSKTLKQEPAPKAEAPAPKAEAPTPKAEAPAPTPAKTSEKSAPKAEAPAPKAEAPTSGYTLLVGCFPIVGPTVTHASDYIASAKRLIENELGLQDYRLAEFGKGPGLLATAVRQALVDSPPDGFVFLDGRTDEGRHAYEAFRDGAAVVVRAL